MSDPGETFVGDGSDAGSWRAALDPAASCAACSQSICAHTDVEYLGIVPPLTNPAPTPGAVSRGGSVPPSDAPAASEFPLSHATGDSRVGR
jgi:hypothetical protein